MVESNAKSFWTSSKAFGYPATLKLKSGDTWEPGVSQREGIGNEMRKLGWIPAQGPILDIGAGSCTKDILGSDLAGNGRTWAVDFASALLEKGGVPKNKRIVDDVTTMRFPDEWENQFSLVYSVLLFRYLTTEQRVSLIHKVSTILAPGGRHTIVDFNKLQANEISQELGEVEAFSTKETAKILELDGFRDIKLGTWDMLFFVGGDKPAPFSVDYVSGVK